MTKPKIGLCQIGYGYWGRNLARNVAANPNAELVALCDPREDARAEWAAAHPETKLYGDIDAALADGNVAAVIVATPSGLHHQHGMSALTAGKHVLVEKPLAGTVAEAVEMVAEARRRGLVLMVGHTFLYNNIVDEVKRRIDAGDIGDPYYAYSQRLNLGRFRRDNDVLWTLAPHDLSILNHWFDGRPVNVSARGHCYVHQGSGVAEVAFAELQYPDGQIAHLHLSWLDPQKRREMIVVGSERMLAYDDMDPDAHIRLYDKKAEAEHQSVTTDFADFATRLRAGDLVVPNIRLIEPLAVEIDHFIGCVDDQATPRSDGWQGVEVVAALEALSRSMNEGGSVVPVAYPEPVAATAAE